MSAEPPFSSSPAPASPEPWTITKDTPIEEVNAHLFPEHRTVPNLSFELPNVLVSTDGQHFTLRNGGNFQLQHEIEDWFSFEEEKDFPMGIQRVSPFIVAGRTIPVLDDKSVPTAEDYLSHLGQRTLWEFSSVPVPMKPGQLPSIYEKAVWKHRRVWIYLPEK